MHPSASKLNENSIAYAMLMLCSDSDEEYFNNEYIPFQT